MISLQFIRSQCDLGAVGQRSYILFLDTGKDEKKKELISVLHRNIEIIEKTNNQSKQILNNSKKKHAPLFHGYSHSSTMLF